MTATPHHRKLQIIHEALATAQINNDSNLESHAKGLLEELGEEINQSFLDAAYKRIRSREQKFERDFITFCLGLKADGFSLEKQQAVMKKIMSM